MYLFALQVRPSPSPLLQRPLLTPSSRLLLTLTSPAPAQMAQLPLIMIGRASIFKRHPALGNVSPALPSFLRREVADARWPSGHAALLLVRSAERVPAAGGGVPQVLARTTDRQPVFSPLAQRCNAGREKECREAVAVVDASDASDAVQVKTALLSKRACVCTYPCAGGFSAPSSPPWPAPRSPP